MPLHTWFIYFVAALGLSLTAHRRSQLDLHRRRLDLDAGPLTQPFEHQLEVLVTHRPDDHLVRDAIDRDADRRILCLDPGEAFDELRLVARRWTRRGRPGPATLKLLLDEREAVALAVGLHGAAHSIHRDVAEASVSALAKVVGMLPPAVRGQVETVADVTVGGQWSDALPAGTLSADVLGNIAQACRDGVRVRFSYSTADGTGSERYVEPYRLVTLASRWYLVAFDVDRGDWRTFRVDRVADPVPSRNTFTPRPLPAEDLVAYIRDRIASMRSVHHVELVVHAPFERVRSLGRWATVTATSDPGRTLLTMDTDSLDWPVLALSSLECDFEVVGPPELAVHLRECAERFARCA